MLICCYLSTYLWIVSFRIVDQLYWKPMKRLIFRNPLEEVPDYTRARVTRDTIKSKIRNWGKGKRKLARVGKVYHEDLLNIDLYPSVFCFLIFSLRRRREKKKRRMKNEKKKKEKLTHT